MVDRAIPMAVAAPPGRLFLGHPPGLAFLAFTEAWERFSFYGMRALLVLYLAQELLLPGHIENVAGMDAYRSALESVVGPLSTQALASQTFGLYAGLVYFTPVFGGLIADRWLGARTTVLIGIALMTAGHFFMAFEWAVLLALLLLILGSGCLKGNIAAQVGHLYPREDESRRSRGFTLFSTGINIGAFLGPLVCGLLAQVYGWHVGFATAGVCMLFAAAIYLAGLKHFAPEPTRGRQRVVHAALTGPEWQVIALIGVVLMFGLTQTLAYDQMFNVGLIWISERVALGTPLGSVPEAWFAAEDALVSVLVVPVLIAVWGWQARRGGEPGDLGKIAIGGVLQAMASGIFALGELFAGDGPVPIGFPVAAFICSGTGFMYMWPTTLALVSRRSPAKTVALMMALAYMTGFVSGLVTGYIGGTYEAQPPVQFWAWQAVLAISGSVLIWLLGPLLRRRMDRLEAETDSVLPAA